MILSPNNFDKHFNLDTPRHYLEQFYPGDKILVVTDQNINQGYNAEILATQIKQSNADRVLIDFSHNPYPIQQHRCVVDQIIATGQQLVPANALINDYAFHINPQENYLYFPVFTWMFNHRRAYWWPTYPNTFDMPSNKTQGLCSLNRNPSWHRIFLFNQLAKRSWFDNVAYTFGNFSPLVNYDKNSRNGLTPAEKQEFEDNQHLLPRWIIEQDRQVEGAVYSIDHPVHETHTFNLITETNMDNKFFHSEKTCKPFMARQIPILLGPLGLNQYLQDQGLDMFEDIVPWKTWDSIENPRERILKTVEFLDELMSKDLLSLYQENIARVEQNKTYFHSNEFKERLTSQLPRS